MNFANTLHGEITALREEIRNLQSTVDGIRSLVGPFGVGMPDGTMLVQTLYGTKYLIDPLDLIIAPNLIIYRQWEADLSSLLTNAANPDTVFVDVGANFGYFTCLLGSRIGRTGHGKVYTIEPNPAMATLLRKNISINWSMAPIDVSECAAADVESTMDFAIPKNSASNASLLNKADNNQRSDTDIIKVPVRPLDQIIPAGTIVDLMKVDVEGYEYLVLEGAQRVISESNNIKIVLEWSREQFQTAGHTVEQLLDQFDRLGLAPFEIPADRQFVNLEMGRLSRQKLADLNYGNIILSR